MKRKNYREYLYNVVLHIIAMIACANIGVSFYFLFIKHFYFTAMLFSIIGVSIMALMLTYRKI